MKRLLVRLTLLVLVVCVLVGATEAPRPSWSLLQIPFPVNMGHPLNAGLRAWWHVLPQVNFGGPVWRSIAIGPDYQFTLTGMNPPTATAGWNVSSRPGAYGELRFDGSASYLTIPYSPDFDFSDTTFTVTMWMRATVDGYLFARRVFSGPVGGYFIRLNSGKADVRILDSNNTVTASRASVSTNLLNGAWRHLAAVFKTDTVTLANNDVAIYVDGVLDQDAGFSSGFGPYVAAALPITVGAISDGTSITFAGAVDDIRVYPRMLQSGEVAALYMESLQPRTTLFTWLPPLSVSLPGGRKARGRIF